MFHDGGPLKTITSPGFGCAEVVGQLVDHDAVAHTTGTPVQRRLHRLGRNQVRPRDEGQHHVVQDHRDDAQDQRRSRTAPRFCLGLASALGVDRFGLGGAGGHRSRLMASCTGHGIRVVSAAPNAVDGISVQQRCTPARTPKSALFLDLGLLATQFTQVVQLGATDVATGHDLDVVDVGRMHREGALDADAVALLAHGEGLADAATLTAHHDALEDLDALLGALDDLDVHIDGVAGAEGRDVVAQRRLIDEVQRVHR